MERLGFVRSAAILVLTASCVSLPAFADSVVYQNTSTAVGGYAFNGSAMVGSNLAANIDINKLTLAPGSAAMSITSLSFQENTDNSGTVSARPVMYIWADNGSGGLPGTLLGTFFLPLQSFASYVPTTLTYNLALNALIVPTDSVIYAGIGFDNDNGMSPITSNQLNNIGGNTYYPATVGTAGAQAYFLPPGGAVSNPSVNPFGTMNGADYGWTVTAAAATTPEPSSLVLLGTGVLSLAGVARRKMPMISRR